MDGPGSGMVSVHTFPASEWPGFPMGICLIQRILASSLSFIELNWESARHVVVVLRLHVMRDVAACRAIHVAAAANAAHFNGGGCGDGMAVLSGCPLLHLSLPEAQVGSFSCEVFYLINIRCASQFHMHMYLPCQTLTFSNRHTYPEKAGCELGREGR
ncbi:hypothetical protein Vretifemale_14773 [Volvox reticuliferus]|uniref:Uncharacterized protein n=1 Tax=Volvox reticuliferus TaxID=1737510 RepID=A0A8J4CW21_9CHLO|nr:hypothetical protein Vretifemale_14773 [Volvox reticuliferus]